MVAPAAYTRTLTVFEVVAGTVAPGVISTLTTTFAPAARLLIAYPLALRIAAFFGFLAVALGAFGAHGLKDVLVRNGTVGIWDKAVLYHAIHTVMLFVLATQTPLKKWSWFSFLIGIVVFSGSLYVLAVSNARWLGAITPIGGISFLAGWACLAIAPNKPAAT